MELGREGRWGRLLWGEGMVEVNLKNACIYMSFWQETKKSKNIFIDKTAGNQR